MGKGKKEKMQTVGGKFEEGEGLKEMAKVDIAPSSEIFGNLRQSMKEVSEVKVEVLTPEMMVRVQKEAAEIEAKISDTVQKIGAGIGSRLGGGAEDSSVKSAIEKIAAAINCLPKPLKEELQKTYLKAMMGFPDNHEALLVMGNALNSVLEAAEEGQGANIIRLPVIADGRYGSRNFQIPDRDLLKELKKKVSKIRETELREMREGTEPFLKVLDDGGLAVAFVPETRTPDGKVYRGGHLKVKVENGKVYPIQATGALRGKIRELKRDGIFVSASAVRDGRLQIGRLPQETFKKVVSLVKILNRGYQKAISPKASQEAAGVPESPESEE